MKLNQTKIAREIGVTQQMVSAMKRGNARPSIEKADALENLFPEIPAIEWMRNPAESFARVLNTVKPDRATAVN